MRRQLAVAAAAMLMAVQASAQKEERPAAKVYRVGVISGAAPRDGVEFRLQPESDKLLAARGLFPGKNLRFDVISVPQPGVDAATKVRKLVATKPDAIFAGTSWQAKVAQDETSTIPIVFNAANPVAIGLVDSLRRPGRNATGVARHGTASTAKDFELMRELLPKARRVAVIANHAGLREDKMFPAALEEMARGLGLELVHGDIGLHGNDGEAAAASTLAARPDAMIVHQYIGPAAVHDRKVAELAKRHRIPFVGPPGDLSVFGFVDDPADVQLRWVAILARVLQGAKPADIPVDQATRFILYVNPDHARAIGVEIPPAIMLRADRVLPQQ